jgi:hypothetical protein
VGEEETWNRLCGGACTRRYGRPSFSFCHAGLACVIVVGVWVVDWLIGKLGLDSEATLMLGRLKLKYLFQAIDVAMIVLFGIAGFVEAAKELFDGRDNNPPDHP